MKKWIVIRNITGLVLLLFALSVLLLGGVFALEEAVYSEPVSGMDRVKMFVMSVGVMFGWWGAPMLAVLGFFIASVVRIKEIKNQEDKLI